MTVIDVELTIWRLAIATRERQRRARPMSPAFLRGIGECMNDEDRRVYETGEWMKGGDAS